MSSKKDYDKIKEKNKPRLEKARHKLTNLDKAALTGIKLFGILDSILGVDDQATKMYNQAINENRTEPFTEKDFSADLLNVIKIATMRDLTQKRNKHGNSKLGKGHFDYNFDLNRAQSEAKIRNTLGGFNYVVDASGGITIKDKYDFNTYGISMEPTHKHQSILRQLDNIWNDPQQVARDLGELILPNKGDGIPIKIKIPGNPKHGPR